MVLNLRVLLVVAALAAAVVFVTQGAFAKTGDGTRPGWGYGDKNHVHTGPPGQSVSVHP
jgi:hypothetical protein